MLPSGWTHTRDGTFFYNEELSIKIKPKLTINSIYTGFHEESLRNGIERAYYCSGLAEESLVLIYFNLMPPQCRYDLESNSYLRIGQMDTPDLESDMSDTQRFLKMIERRYHNINQYCIICGCYLMELGDKVPADHIMYCSSPLCRDKFQNLRVLSLADIISADPVVADIKLNMYYNFISGGRAELNLPVHLAGNTVYDVKKVLDSIGSVHRISAAMETVDPNYTLILWILTNYQLITIQDKKEYRIIQYDYTKMVEFEKLRSTAKTCDVVYHGSKPDCWSNILQNGLICYSGTKYMTVGAAYGQGIYVGQTEAVSRTYTTSFPVNRPGTIFPLTSKSIIMKCHLLDAEDPAVAKKGPGMYIVTDKSRLSLLSFTFV